MNSRFCLFLGDQRLHLGRQQDILAPLTALGSS